MKRRHTLGLAILSSTLLLGGCTDPISALLIKAGENSMYNIDSVRLYDRLTIDTKPDNGTNVRVSNNMFVELDNIERIKHDTKSFSLDITTVDDFDSELIKSQIEKEFKKIGYTLDDNAEPIVITILDLGAREEKTERHYHTFGGLGSVLTGIGATAMQAVATEAVASVAGAGASVSDGIARSVTYSIAYNDDVRNMKLEHVNGTNIKLNNPVMIKIRDINTFTAMIAKSTAELLTPFAE